MSDIVERVVSLVLEGEDWGEELAWLVMSEGEREVLREREKALEREELRQLRLSREIWAEGSSVSYSCVVQHRLSSSSSGFH